MKAKRLWWTIRTCMCRGAKKRADYARKNKIYASMGENVTIQSRVIPLYSELIAFHNNISIARNVDFVTHDVIDSILNRLPKKERFGFDFKERVGCIEIMDNVFVGSNSIILYGVRIGPNVIVASGSVVTKDCEPDSVYAGCPARKISGFEEYVLKRVEHEKHGKVTTTKNNQAMEKEEVEKAWHNFFERHG